MFSFERSSRRMIKERQLHKEDEILMSNDFCLLTPSMRTLSLSRQVCTRTHAAARLAKKEANALCNVTSLERVIRAKVFSLVWQVHDCYSLKARCRAIRTGWRSTNNTIISSGTHDSDRCDRYRHVQRKTVMIHLRRVYYLIVE